MNRYKKIIQLILGFGLLSVISLYFISNLNEPKANPSLKTLDHVYMENHYSHYLNQKPDVTPHDQKIMFSHVDFLLENGEEAYLENDYYRWENHSNVSMTFDVIEAGHYAIDVTYQALGASHLPINLSLYLNHEEQSPYYEASQMVLDALWYEASEPGIDRYKNDVHVMQSPYLKWQTLVLTDARKLYKDGLTVYLESGLNVIEIQKNSGELLLKEITLRSVKTYDAYNTYVLNHQMQQTDEIIKIEAEHNLYKNSSTIVRGINRDPLVEPFSINRLKLNVLGTDSFDQPGDKVTYQADVSAPGLYHITLKVLQNIAHTTVYRTIYINGEIPFLEAKHIPISYHKTWQNVTLSGFDQEPFLFYLEPGDLITVEVDGTLFKNTYEHLRNITQEITALGLDITKLTRNNTDRGIDWDMILYFPDLPQTLNRWMDELNETIDVLRHLYGFDKDAQVIRDFRAAIAKLESIASNINELPRRLTLLSTGSSSALQLIANQLDTVVLQPMVFDAFYIHTNPDDLPNPVPNFWQRLVVFVSRFVHSFMDPAYRESSNDDVLEVWVNRPRQYVDLIQRLTDTHFSKDFDIPVRISLMNDDSKLLLANSANQQPDVALGVSAWIPIEYGMRGMLKDLSTFSDFGQTISVYHPEQLIPMVYDQKLYGLPETQNFYVMFYRRDIIVDQLNLEVPQTWDDVLSMLPVLRRYGMSFYVPLSSMSAQKSFDATAPFIFQFGGSIYREDGFSAAIDQEQAIRALNFMTDLFREYAIPYQVPSFFNSFRYQDIPIGIGDFGMYLQLMNAAADISGLWEIAVVPGISHDVYDEESQTTSKVINRSMPGAQQSGIIFEKSLKHDQAWQFLSWWMSTATQTLFYETLLNTLGTRYLWNSANLEAFENFRWNETHKKVILEQWSHLKEVPKIPGSYIIEREISNTWNRVVYEDANLRATVSDAMLRIDRELQRKMIEFGYLDQRGQVIRPFILPSKSDVLRWYPNDET